MPLSKKLRCPHTTNLVANNGNTTYRVQSIVVIIGLTLTQFSPIMACLQYKKFVKIFIIPTYKLLSSFMVISDVCKSFIPIKTTFAKYCLTQLDFKAPRELWNPLSKAVPGKFLGSGRQNNHKCLQDRANFTQVSGMANCPYFKHGKLYS